MVSQDCGHAETAAAIGRYGDKVTHIKVSVNMAHFYSHNIVMSEQVICLDQHLL